jgi:hypothetical protein
MAVTRQTMTDEQRKSVALEYLEASTCCCAAAWAWP